MDERKYQSAPPEIERNTSDTLDIPPLESKDENEPAIREYYEAESWQFSGCGD